MSNSKNHVLILTCRSCGLEICKYHASHENNQLYCKRCENSSFTFLHGFQYAQHNTLRYFLSSFRLFGLLKKYNILVIINTIIKTAIKTSDYHWAKEIQERIAKKIVTDDSINREMESICGIDVCYRSNITHCSAVIMNNSFKIIESANTKSSVKYPYVPSLFMTNICLMLCFSV